jgi:hypothetical protein
VRTDPFDGATRRTDRHQGWFTTASLIGCAVGLLSTVGCASSMKNAAKPSAASDKVSSVSSAGGSEGAEPADRLAVMIGDERTATAVSYSTRDTIGHPLDTLKVIAGPRNEFLGTYHFRDKSGVFMTAIATSSDLLRWTFVVVLTTHASQPTLVSLDDGSYVLIAEADDQGLVKPASRWLRFWHYPSLSALLHASSDRTFDAPRTLGKQRGGAEGTPSVYSATPSVLRVGFHYLAPGGVDRQGVGELRDLSSWTARADTELDAALSAVGAAGKHGDRDCITFAGRQLVVIEAQRSLDSAWEIYIYDRVTHRAQLVPITTPESSTAFANPSVTVLKAPKGRTLVVALFLPSSGSSAAEVGEVVQYRESVPDASLDQCA